MPEQKGVRLRRGTPQPARARVASARAEGPFFSREGGLVPAHFWDAAGANYANSAGHAGCGNVCRACTTLRVHCASRPSYFFRGAGEKNLWIGEKNCAGAATLAQADATVG